MSSKKEKWIKLNPYNNPFVDKIEEMDRQLDEVILKMKEQDDKRFQTFPGWRWFKFRDPKP